MVKAIIFDKDGTMLDLGNTWEEPTIKVIDELMSLTSLSEQEITALKESMGIEGQTLIPNTLLSAGSIAEQADKLVEVVPMQLAEIETYLEDYYYQYLMHTDVDLKVIGNIEQILKQLKPDYVLGVVTNDNHRLTEATLTKAGLIKYFDWIASADQFQPKPDPIALYDLAQKHDLELDDMVYIGDSTVDMEYGKHTLASIGIAVEPEHREFLKEADYIIERFDELPLLIDQIKQKKQGLSK